MKFEPRILGRTRLRVGPLGVAASYGVPASAVERAFHHGVNYLYWVVCAGLVLAGRFVILRLSVTASDSYLWVS